MLRQHKCRDLPSDNVWLSAGELCVRLLRPDGGHARQEVHRRSWRAHAYYGAWAPGIPGRKPGRSHCSRTSTHARDSPGRPRRYKLIAPWYSRRGRCHNYRGARATDRTGRGCQVRAVRCMAPCYVGNANALCSRPEKMARRPRTGNRAPRPHTALFHGNRKRDCDRDRISYAVTFRLVKNIVNVRHLHWTSSSDMTILVVLPIFIDQYCICNA